MTPQTLFMTIGWAGCAIAAQAQMAPAPGLPSTGEVERMPTIYVTEILPRSIDATPGAVSTLTAAELAVFRPYTVHDALAFLPGVHTIDDDVLGRRSAIGIRGGPPRRSRKVLLLEDGTPINASTYLDPSAHYTPPMERLERIDVLKGAGHVLHGPGNNHGIVNFRNQGPTPTPETKLDVSVGSFDSFKRHAMHTRTDGNVGLVLAYTGVEADGVFDLEHTRFDDYFAHVQWAPVPQHDLGLSFTYFRERSRYDESNLTPQEYAVAPRTKLGRFGQEYNSFALNYLKLDLVHHYTPSPRLMISTKLFATDMDRPRYTVEPGETEYDDLPEIHPSDPFNPALGIGEMISRDRHYRTFGFEERIELAAAPGGAVGHTLQGGVRVERHFLNDNRTGGEPGEVLSIHHRGSVTREQAYQATALSMFFQDVIHTGKWTITPGVRAERYTQNKVRLPIDLDPGPHGPKQRDANTLLLPSLSVLHDAGQGTQFFANAARGYTPAFARTAAGFPLIPETGINLQVGTRSNPAKGVSYEAAAFWNLVKDTVVQLPFTFEGQDIYLNSEDSQSRGLEVALQLDSSPRTGSPWNVLGKLALSYTDARFTAGLVDGRQVPEVPRHAGSVTFGIEYRNRWHLSATLSHFGSFYTDPANTEALTLADEDGVVLGPGDDVEIREPIVFGQVPGHTLLSARASFLLPGNRATVWIQGRNLADKLYIVDLQNGLRPGALRTLNVGVTLKF
jgi:Fe(3+) dicitrate transport protein